MFSFFQLFDYWVVLHAFLSLLIFFKINFLEKFSGISPECQTIGSRTFCTCKGYQQTTVTSSKFCEGCILLNSIQTAYNITEPSLMYKWLFHNLMFATSSGKHQNKEKSLTCQRKLGLRTILTEFRMRTGIRMRIYTPPLFLYLVIF